MHLFVFIHLLLQCQRSKTIYIYILLIICLIFYRNYEEPELTFDQSLTESSSPEEQFEEIQYEKNYLNSMIKISEVTDTENETIVAKAVGLNKLRLSQDGHSKDHTFNHVFGPDDKDDDVFKYLKYYTDCVLNGEDCNIVGYGGKKTNQAKILYGSVQKLDGLVYKFLLNLLEKIKGKGMEGKLSMSLTLVDVKDVPHDGFASKLPAPYSLKISKERYGPGMRDNYVSEIFDPTILNWVTIEDPAGAVNLIQTKLNDVNMKGKIGSTLLTIKYEGEDEFRIIAGRINIIEVINSDWLIRSELTKNSFQGIIANISNAQIINYALTNLTYLLRDSLCKYVRTTVIGFISPSITQTALTAKTVETLLCCYKDGKNVELGKPLQRQIYKLYELDGNVLIHLRNQIEAEKSYLEEEISNCVESDVTKNKGKILAMNLEQSVIEAAWRQAREKAEEETEMMKKRVADLKVLQKDYLDKKQKLESELDSVEDNYYGVQDEIDLLQLEMITADDELAKVQSELAVIKDKHTKLTEKRKSLTVKDQTNEEEQDAEVNTKKRTKKVNPIHSSFV